MHLLFAFLTVPVHFILPTISLLFLSGIDILAECDTQHSNLPLYLCVGTFLELTLAIYIIIHLTFEYNSDNDDFVDDIFVGINIVHIFCMIYYFHLVFVNCPTYYYYVITFLVMYKAIVTLYFDDIFL